MYLPFVSLITTCKGRLHHLRETIQSMLMQDYAGPWEIVVVDYDCPDGTFDFVRSLDLPRVRCVKVSDTIAPWSMAHARNVGAKFANGSVLAFVDADNHPAPEYLATGVSAMNQGGASLCVPMCDRGGIAGACFVTAALYHAVRGNDESMIGYGYDDIDFYARCESEGRPSFRHFPRCTISSNLLRLIHHGDEIRTEFLGDVMAESIARNQEIGRDPSRAVNLNGYGRTSRYQTHGAIYPPAIRDLRRRHQWPAERPNLGHNDHGWMGEGNRRILARLLTEIDPRCVLEVGTWLGLSARFILDHSSAHVVTVDLWDQAIVGPAMLAEAGLGESRTLYDQFVANMWPHRDRLTPIRAGTVDGIWLARDAGLQPELVYIDAAHDRDSFEADLAAAARAFPAATLCGDDWGWGGPDHYTIRPAVTALAASRGQRVETDGECWAIIN